MSNPTLTDKTLAQLGANDLGCKRWTTASKNDKSSDLVCNHHKIPLMSASWKNSHQLRKVSDLLQFRGLTPPSGGAWCHNLTD
jgi:hypothetical protein